MIATGRVGTKDTKTKISGTLKFTDNVFADYLIYKETPLADVSLKALQSVFERNLMDLGKYQWRARVVKDLGNNKALIDAGQRSGLEVGDRMNLYPVEHYWEGDACHSEYIGSLASEEEKVAVSVISLGDDVAVIETPKKMNWKVKLGDEVSER